MDEIKKISILNFLIIFFLASLSVCGEDIKSFTKIGLWTGGTKLRGVNIYQRRIYPELDDDLLGKGSVGPVYTLEDFRKLRGLGVNYVNISCPGIFTETPPYVPDKKILDNLEKLLKMIKESDMFAVISFRTGPGRSEFTFFYGEDFESDPENGWFDKSYYNEKVWTDKKAREGWLKMWKYTAEYFKNNSVIIGYDLMVEPNSNGVLLDIWDASEFYGKYKGTTYDWNTLFPDIVKAIREKDKETPVLIQSQNYADPGWMKYMKLVDDKKVVYIAHQYDPMAYTHQSADAHKTYPGFYDIDYDDVPDNFNKEWLEKHIKNIEKFKEKTGVIVAVNEYGGVRWAPDIDRFFRD